MHTALKKYIKVGLTCVTRVTPCGKVLKIRCFQCYACVTHQLPIATVGERAQSLVLLRRNKDFSVTNQCTLIFEKHCAKNAKRGENMTRKEELLKIFESIEDTKGIIRPMIDDVVFLEEQLEGLRKLPFIRVNPADPSQQKSTPAAKQYKELLQQYNNCVKILTGVVRKDAPEEASPLRAFLTARKEHLS